MLFGNLHDGAHVGGLPVEVHRHDSAGLRVVCATPALFAAGWLPDGHVLSDGVVTGRLPAIDGDVVLRAAFADRLRGDAR